MVEYPIALLYNEKKLDRQFVVEEKAIPFALLC
jgi:hypothetical protein